ncbi:MAG: hypothetical protein JXB49_21475 [Bacteroidales bacterium]|nr:hypothetical protein [Bacteroidales bacterium]
MIVVIADDFTGAAEIGGVGLRYGLDVVIETEDIAQIHTDLLVVATDTRSLNGKEAAGVIKNVANKVMALKPDFIYKKIDSVLRGNVFEELLSQMTVTGMNKAIVIPANPSFKRIIRKGVYYINGTPLHETFFSNDPEYPVTSSYVDEIVGKESVHSNIKSNDDLPSEGIILGDVGSIEDLKSWTSKIDDKTLPAGGSGFFREILTMFHIKPHDSIREYIPFGENALYIMGSTFPKQYSLTEKISESSHYLSNMPGELYINPDINSHYIDEWANDVAEAMKNHKKVVIAIPQKSTCLAECTGKIRNAVGVMVKKVFDQTPIDELIIEGGATTWAILKALEINELKPFYEFETGVIRMNVKGRPGLHITTKPGSYLWPDEIWYLGNNEQMNTVTQKEEVK